MTAREQFAGWGMYDHVAVCLTCGHEHLIAKDEQITEQPWLNWIHKHQGHENFLLPHKLRTALGNEVALRHNADAKIAYAATGTYAITVTSLASDTNLLAGRQGDSLTNTSNKYLDEIFTAQVRSGASMTANRAIEFHIVGAFNDSTSYPTPFATTDAAITIGFADQKYSMVAPIAIIGTTQTAASVQYWVRPTGIRQLFADGLPVAHAPFITQSTGQNLNATATTHIFAHTPVYATVT